MTTPTTPSTPRQVADRYVEAAADLDPILATSLGNRPGDDRLPDFGPEGIEAEAALLRSTLAELDRVVADPSVEADPIERRCARLLRERLGPNWPPTRRARASGHCRTCSAPCTPSGRCSR